MKISQKKPFQKGYTPITHLDDKINPTLMDFGILVLSNGQSQENSDDLERAYLLIKGEVTLEWNGHKQTIKRLSFLDEAPWCLHLQAGEKVKITGVADETEISVTKTNNDNSFPSKFYTPIECASELRGKGMMNETSTRTVRTIFDYHNAPYSKLVIGEVINTPGKWSSYPPHHHQQPEIYYYRMFPENGYGFSQLGEKVVKVKNSDTVLIIHDESHPQVAAPGYAMYYVWVIRHLDENPYITPVFETEHLWISDKDARIWPD